MGGQLPVTGAAVQLYVAGASGYGSGATPLGPAAITDSSGAFTIQGNITCPSSSALTYVTATGGHTGSGPDNAAIVMMAAPGNCGNLNASTAVINEVTTVAAAWALTPFLGPGGAIGTSAGNAKGLANAFANASSLADIASGAAPGKAAPANATIPIAKINTLADILSACVEQSSAGACSTLFAAATPAGGSAPGNTLDAAVDLARNPALSPATLFALAGSSSPFQPILAAAPPDWMLALTFTGGGLNTPTAIGVDASGNLWVANYFSAVTELASSGTPLSPAAGFTGGGLNESFGLAVNQDGNVWVTDEQSPGVNSGHGAVTVLNPSGQPLSGTGGYFDGGVFYPFAAAADTDGSVWIANYADSTATKFAAAGTAISPSTRIRIVAAAGPGGGGDRRQPHRLVRESGGADRIGNLDLRRRQHGQHVRLWGRLALRHCHRCDRSGSRRIRGPSVDVELLFRFGERTGAAQRRFSDSGRYGVYGRRYLHPNGIAVDGAGNVWVTNYRGASMTELQGAERHSLEPRYRRLRGSVRMLRCLSPLRWPSTPAAMCGSPTRRKTKRISSPSRNSWAPPRR